MTPGQKAYEAYVSQAESERWPGWNLLSESTQEIWEQAAIGTRLSLVNEVVQVRDNGALSGGHIVAIDPQILVRMN